MKSLSRLCGLFLLCALLPAARGQLSSARISKIEIKHVGPPAVSDEMVRSNIRVKVGDPFRPAAVDEDVRSLYGTGMFYNIRISEETTSEGVGLTYVVQGKPRLTDVKFQGNTKFSAGKLRKKLTSKVGEPLNEQKLFTDSQEIQKLYQKSGYPRTQVNAVPNIDENAGRATATFVITETPKVKIVKVDFVGAQAFPLKVGFFEKLFHPSRVGLRKTIKTRRHWMLSWLTGSGYLKDEQFEEDQEKLKEFYREKGYIDFDIKEVQFLNPTPRALVIRFVVYEGTQYKVGSVKFTGNKLFSTNELANGLRVLRPRARTGPHGLVMDVGDTFTPKGLANDTEAVEDVYGSKGFIGDASDRHVRLNVVRIPNTETGTMDLEFQIDEGQKSYIEKIEIRGNTKTKDKVIRRELAVSPGEVFDMVGVKLSQQRLEGLQFFDKVDARPEPSEISPTRKNLVVGVDEKNTGNLTMGAGFSSVDAIVGFVELSQGNFDLFHPPTFTGGGQKFRLRVQIGTQRQDYVLSFIEPWFLGRKLSLGTELYYRDLNFQSLDNIYDEIRAGGRVSLEKALGSDFLRGSLSYTLEDVGIRLNSGFHGPEFQTVPLPGPGGSPGGVGPPTIIPANVPNAILTERGYHLLSRVGGSLIYDTRNGGLLPNKGQRTELFGEFVGGPIGGDKKFYKLDLKTAWYFKGFAPGHVLELIGEARVADSLESGDVPFYERYYLGGLYSLRGFKYRSISPREPGFHEPIGGDTSWFGSAEYSIPIIERLRFAFFYDIGAVAEKSYKFNLDGFDDNWGVGLRLVLPIGPLRLDYGIPIHHDQYNGSSGQFQFGVGYTREF